MSEVSGQHHEQVDKRSSRWKQIFKKHAPKLVVLIFLSTGIYMLVRVIAYDPTKHVAADAPEASYKADTVLVKIKKDKHSKLKSRKPKADDTGLPDLDKVNANNHAAKFEPVAVAGKNSDTNSDLFRWYKVSLKEDAKRTVNPKDNKEEDSQFKAILKQYKSSVDVETAEPDFQVQAELVPNDPYYSSSGAWGQAFEDLWGLKKINAAAAWDKTTGSASIIVASIDTGVDLKHADLKDNIWYNPGEPRDAAGDCLADGIDHDGNGYKNDCRGWDFFSDDNNPDDDYGHGTHTVGTIAGKGNNGLGVVGVNWTSRVMALKFLNNNGGGYMEDSAAALQYAADNGARVTNNSYGCGCTSQITDDGVKYAFNKGSITVVSAGNSNADALGFSPAGSDYSVTIGATDVNDLLASFSNAGSRIDVTAPGVDTLSTKASSDTVCTSRHYIVNTDYCHLSGTSMAAPHTAGLAALLLAKNPNLTNEEVRQILRASATDLGVAGQDTAFGYGRINAAEAMNKVDTHPLTPVITSPSSRTMLGSTVDFTGSIGGPNFASYKLEYGPGRAPSSWTTIATSTTQVTNGRLGTLTASSLPDGRYTARLTATDSTGKTYQAAVYDLNVQHFIAEITSPTQIFNNTVDIKGTAQAINGTTFSRYTLEYGSGANPTVWQTTNLTVANNGTQPVSAGVLGSWSPAGLTDPTYTLRLTVYGTNGKSLQTLHSISSDTSILVGWPKAYALGDTVSGLALGDINNDGKEEVVSAVGLQAGYTDVHAYKKDGSELSGWPVNVHGNALKVTLADLTGDRIPEVILSSTSSVYVYSGNGTVLAGWPKQLPSFGTSALAVGDLDGNGTNEVVVQLFGITATTSSSSVIAYNGNGTVVSGFPKLLESGLPSASAGRSQGPVLVDLDGSRKLSIVVNTMERVYVTDYQGNMRAGWPKSIGWYAERMVAGDITGDNKPEIIIYYDNTTGGLGGGLRYINVYDAAGNVLPGWPLKASNGVTRMGPALTDANRDGVLDILMPMFGDGNSTGPYECSPLIYTKAGLQTRAPSCDIFDTGSEVAPTLVDIDNDGLAETINGNSPHLRIDTQYQDAIGLTGWKNHPAWSHDAWGKNVPSIPWETYVSDIDKNGKWEVVTYTHELNALNSVPDYILAWELPSSVAPTGAVGWPMRMQNPARTGVYVPSTGSIPPPPPADNINPVVSLTAPVNGATISGTTTLAATASDNSGTVSRVDFKVDGAVVNSDTATPFSYSWNGSTSNGGHTITATAYDPTGNHADASANVTVSIDATRPTPPTSIDAASGCNTTPKVTLTWSGAGDNVAVTGYNIKRATGTSTTFTPLGSTSANSYIDTGSTLALALNTSYTYQVFALDAAGNVSLTPATKSATTPTTCDTARPSDVTGLSSSAAAANKVNLSWNVATDTGDSGLKGYYIYRAVAPSTTPVYVGQVGLTTAYPDNAVVANTSYNYWVKAIDGASNLSLNFSNMSTVKTPATTDTQAPNPPLNVLVSSVAGSSTQLNIKWDAAIDNPNPGGSGIKNYDVYRSTSPTTSPTLIYGGATTTSYGDTGTYGGANGLQPGTKYYYYIKARDNNNNVSTTFSAEASGTTNAATTSLQPPTNLSLSPGTTWNIWWWLDVFWTPPASRTNVTGYRAEVYDGATLKFTGDVDSTKNTIAINWDNLANGTHTLRVYSKGSGTPALSGPVEKTFITRCDPGFLFTKNCYLQ